MVDNIDFGHTAKDYVTYRVGFPDSLYERIAEFGIGVTDQNIVDLGTGTGTLARGFASRGCQVIGIDPSEDMLKQARDLENEIGEKVEYKIGTAENTSLPSNSADVVTAGQCWHWFDRPSAAREARRLLRPGGKIAIIHYDWLPLNGNVVDLTEELIQKHNPEWNMGGGNGLYPQWQQDLGEAGYEEFHSFSYDEQASYTPEAWRGRIRASAGVGASLSPEQVEVFDNELSLLLSEKFPLEIMQVPHRVFAVIARTQ